MVRRFKEGLQKIKNNDANEARVRHFAARLERH
jgi:hypothetical protein